jgi:hypothetical protein
MTTAAAANRFAAVSFPLMAEDDVPTMSNTRDECAYELLRDGSKIRGRIFSPSRP